MKFHNCVVLLGPELEPYFCRHFEVQVDTITKVDRVRPCTSAEGAELAIIPGFYNAHTHIGDGAFPDGATGLTLEEGFFRPHGFKYRQLAQTPDEILLQHMVEYQHYMARTGTIAHIDFREQGTKGAELLREASRRSGVESIILSQFTGTPFSAEALQANVASLTAEAQAELEAILAVADGFSESTMNDLTDTAWEMVRSLTHAQGKLRAIHCLENDGYRDTSLKITGKGDLARALAVYDPDLIVHLTVANAIEIALMASSRASAALNPRANANLGLPLPPVAQLLEAGVNLLLGTDNGMLNSPNLLAELDFTYKLAKSQYGDAVRPDPRQILKMVTANVRHLLGVQRGYLQEGMPADFLVINLRQAHLRHTQHLLASLITRVTPEDIVATLRHGRLLYGKV